MGDVTFPWGRGYELIYVNGDGWTGPRESPVLRVIHSASAATREGHPTPKPLGLMAAIIRKAPPGVVADPFAGSGSTLRAAKDEGRKAIGVEIDERYCEIAAKRLAQDTLFGGVA
jgi:site-specific DNA-methyltransferase (adenine-specific)